MANLKSAATGVAGGAMRCNASPAALNPVVGDRIDDDVGDHGVGGGRDHGDVAGLGVVGAVELARDRQREELRDEDRLLRVVAGRRW